MNQEQVCLVNINVHTTEALHQSSVQIMELAMRVTALEHGLWNPVVANNDSSSETVVTDKIILEENEEPILVPPPGQLIETVDYAREEFVLAGGGLEEGLEIERVLHSDSEGIRMLLGMGGRKHIRLIAIDYRTVAGTAGAECKGDRRSKGPDGRSPFRTPTALQRHKGEET